MTFLNPIAERTTLHHLAGFLHDGLEASDCSLTQEQRLEQGKQKAWELLVRVLPERKDEIRGMLEFALARTTELWHRFGKYLGLELLRSCLNLPQESAQPDFQELAEQMTFAYTPLFYALQTKFEDHRIYEPMQDTLFEALNAYSEVALERGLQAGMQGILSSSL